MTPAEHVLLFQEFVRGYPVEKLARKLGITPACVRYWLRREATPTVPRMIELIRLSKGLLTFQGIVEATVPPDEADRVRRICK